jgi:recombination protein RecA
MEAVANFFMQYPEGKAWYNEAEAAFDVQYARALGIPIDKVGIKNDCATVEDLFNHLDTVLKEAKKNVPGLYILDSLDALSDSAELDRGINEGSYGAAKAKQLSQLFRRLIRRLEQSNVCLLIVSQVRDSIGVAFGDKHSRSGGKALDFYASQVIWLAHLKLLKRTISKVERPYGTRIRAKCKKNKVGLPWRECEFEIHFGYGIRDMEASAEWLTSVGERWSGAKTANELRVMVQRKWSEIETSFLPKERKYGSN